MVEQSKGFRSGTLSAPPIKGRLYLDNTNDIANSMRYVSIAMKSTIQIGQNETVEEETKVLLLGEAVTNWWNGLTPAPSLGDRIRISYATMYIRNGVLCMRVTEPDQIEVLPQKGEQPSVCSDVSKTTITAQEFFEGILRAREERK